MRGTPAPRPKPGASGRAPSGAAQRLLLKLEEVALQTGSGATVRQLGEAMGWRSKGTTWRYLDELEAGGWLVRLGEHYWPADVPLPEPAVMAPVHELNALEAAPGRVKPLRLVGLPSSVAGNAHSIFAIVAPSDFDGPQQLAAGDLLFFRRTGRFKGADLVLRFSGARLALTTAAAAGRVSSATELSEGCVIGVAVASLHAF